MTRYFIELIHEEILTGYGIKIEVNSTVENQVLIEFDKK